MNKEVRTKERKQQRNRVIFFNTLVFVVVISCLVWLVRSYFHIGDKDFTNAAQVEEYINPINTRVSAYIKEIRFSEHQKVSKGDTLIILDKQELLTQVQQSEAAYQNALASKTVTEASINTLLENIKVANANIEGAKATLETAKKNLERYANLLKSEAITGYQYDQVETEYEKAKSSYDALVQQRKATESSVAETKARLNTNEAEIQRSKAALDMSKINLSYTAIIAPFDGTMGRRLINQGQLLQTGQQVSTIVESDKKWVTANFLESQMPKIEVGTKMKMTVDAIGNDVIFEGTVTAISAATGSRYSSIPVDNSTGNFVKVQQRIPVRIDFTSDNKLEQIEKLKAGMNVEVKIKK